MDALHNCVDFVTMGGTTTMNYDYWRRSRKVNIGFDRHSKTGQITCRANTDVGQIRDRYGTLLTSLTSVIAWYSTRVI